MCLEDMLPLLIERASEEGGSTDVPIDSQEFGAFCFVR